ncbi:serine hydrolase family protein [Candidatus Woesearchaeota archaeon]|nr:serine hydrolase family protein [Candidatus Woesearchaeota archaeon]
MRKRVFVVHGWGFNSNMNWYNWLKEQLERKNFEVKILEMPNTEEPKIKEWVNFLSKSVGKSDKNTYFIGHSIGCQTIMRYLQKINSKIGGAFFVAGWFNLINLEDKEVEKIAEPWLKTKINFTKVKNNINKLTVVLSDNDPYNCLEENTRIFKEKLNAKVIIEKNKGHFTSQDGGKNLEFGLKQFF